MKDGTRETESLDMLRRFAGVHEGDEKVLKLCLMAAVKWYANAGVTRGRDGELYDFWVCNLAAWFYDNRGIGGDDARVPSCIVTSVHQLRRSVKGMKPQYYRRAAGARPGAP